MSRNNPKILFVANIDKEHILKFHIPTIRMLRNKNWIVDVACAGNEEIPYCSNRFVLHYERSPFTPKLFKGISELYRIIKENDYDIVYCHTPVGGLAARIASIKARKKRDARNRTSRLDDLKRSEKTYLESLSASA